jgi:hypothetical protein
VPPPAQARAVDLDFVNSMPGLFGDRTVYDESGDEPDLGGGGFVPAAVPYTPGVIGCRLRPGRNYPAERDRSLSSEPAHGVHTISRCPSFDDINTSQSSSMAPTTGWSTR